MDSLNQDVSRIGQIEAIPSILQVICHSTGMGFAAVARVTHTRWMACEVLDNAHFGLEAGSELQLESTLCTEVRAARQEVVIDNIAEDEDCSGHHTPAQYGFQSYISVPIILPDGEFFGTLCALDAKPRKLKGTTTPGMFRLFAELIAFHIDANHKLTESRFRFADSQSELARSRSDQQQAAANLAHSQEELAESAAHLAQSDKSLATAKGEADLREQFIAVLGHDLRNPLASVAAGISRLKKQPTPEMTDTLLLLMNESVQRMFGLIDNLMDFAKGRLGGGIGIDIVPVEDIEPALAQVVDELRSIYPQRDIEFHADLKHPVSADHARIGQMLSNLLANAITHGKDGTPVSVAAKSDDDRFTLSVTNQGESMSPEAIERLFQPFKRGNVGNSLQGLGLGLYIANEIAVAHGGTINVESGMETRFTFVMPSG